MQNILPKNSDLSQYGTQTKVLFAPKDTTEKEETACQEKVSKRDKDFLEKIHRLEVEHRKNEPPYFKKIEDIEVSSDEEDKDSNSSKTDEEKSLTGDEEMSE
jgi:transcription antitermination factor NusA-like protein